MRRLLLLLPLFALAGCKDPQDGVRVIVTYQQFVPGCIRVTALDDASGDKSSTDVAVRGTAAADGQVVVAVLVPEKWGTQLTVTADAFEAPPDGSTCVSPAVRSNTQGITVQKGSAKKGTPQELTLAVNADDADSDGYVATGSGGTDCNDAAGAGALVHPNAAELCNGQDENCDGTKDEGLDLNAPCTADNTCSGVKACKDNLVFCNAPPPQLALVDNDEDKFGALGGAPVPTCLVNGELPKNRLPPSSPSTDCDDTNIAINPGAPEICNGVNDNCAAGIDEGFAVNTSCTDNPSQCSGTNQCNPADGGTLCQLPVPPPTWYPDNDTDGRGLADAGIASCAIQPDAGYVLDGGDCDDGNPFIYTAAAELCDEQDNNCNGTADDGALCPSGGAKWSNQIVYDAGTDWFDVSLYADGGTWIVGNKSSRAVKLPAQNTFNAIAGDCTNGSTQQTLYSVWAHPQTGTAYIGRDQGALLIQNPGDNTCTPRVSLSGGVKDLDTRGLTGFAAGGNLRIFGVGNEGGHGAAFEWGGGTANVPTQQVTGTPLNRVHGLSPEFLFAVGKNNGTGRGVIYRWDTGTSAWKLEQGVPNVPPLRGIHVVNAKLAFAAGDDRTLLRWDGTTWNTVTDLPPVPTPPDTPPPENYTGVLAFGAKSIYVITESGSIYRYNGEWTFPPRITSFYGIAGTSPEDIWVVGRFGNVLHYPAWPQ
ncbi:hypothetical protein D7V97_41240 [Corallococcus sp. CA053C]|uniref:putative metal-binding motif-containing protein n=1 Tax=Corallococcus sp. CA053C TaxID=2316732 RepID=UPI000EA2C70E|nr:putative metal-binding motif-containing protein [Corallococcus sp. CA053C]RKG92078.1 hypothetical protein D7V97_41240 [Corallococcus sp. CA053C]